ncbi:effeeaa9-ca72-4d5f-b05e-7d8f8c337a40 [Sclerotinia trifoliorum]|uniref:Effeeaa9-ca72-4d5f-b05e-7d8f8c337a40 n=1 Tax=Sclerotinia trifoliorum TaxID=28548 RepID=A0A8H2ZT58_9HELO|nr:effeeaa9-ca72-4d5f-b05e-7d8f8c337a40 [Sclerotinia trifoliorum]
MAKAELAMEELRLWDEWWSNCPDRRYRGMTSSQLESKRMSLAGDFYRSVADADTTKTLDEKKVLRYAHTGRIWLSWGRTLGSGSKSPAGAALTLAVADNTKGTSQFDLVQKRFSATHLLLVEKWITDFEPEIGAFCLFLDPFAKNLHACKLGSMASIEKSFKQFMEAFLEKRFEHDVVPFESYKEAVWMIVMMMTTITQLMSHISTN